MSTSTSPRLSVQLMHVNRTFPDPVSHDALLDDSLDALLALADPPSRADVRKFRFLQDARRCLLGRLLTRYVASARLDRPWDDSVFGRSDQGRPFVVQDRTSQALFDFNVSHDENLVVVACLVKVSPHSTSSPSSSASVAHPSRVGVDVMRIRNPWPGSDVTEFISGIQEQLTVQEQAALSRYNVTPGAQPERSEATRSALRHALALWTLKEAYVKATGEGLHRDLSTIDFSLLESTASSDEAEVDLRIGSGRLEGQRIDGWRFFLTEIEDGTIQRDVYWLAVAEQAEGAAGEVHLVQQPEWLLTVDLAQVETLARSAP